MMAANNDSYIAVNPLAVCDATFYMTIESSGAVSYFRA